MQGLGFFGDKAFESFKGAIPDHTLANWGM